MEQEYFLRRELDLGRTARAIDTLRELEELVLEHEKLFSLSPEQLANIQSHLQLGISEAVGIPQEKILSADFALGGLILGQQDNVYVRLVTDILDKSSQEIVESGFMSIIGYHRRMPYTVYKEDELQRLPFVSIINNAVLRKDSQPWEVDDTYHLLVPNPMVHYSRIFVGQNYGELQIRPEVKRDATEFARYVTSRLTAGLSV